MNDSKNTYLASICQLIGHYFLSNFFFLVALGWLGFYFSLSISSYHYPLSILLSIVFLYFINKKSIAQLTFQALSFLSLSCILVSAFLLFFLQFIYDISWDGTEYHQQAIIELYHGWNPLLNPFKGIDSADTYVFSYAKSSWIAQASLYAITNNIQSAKALHFMMMFGASAFIVSLLLSLKKIKLKIVFLLAFAAIFNPVTTSQFFTFYLDGILYCCMVCMIILLVQFFRDDNAILYLPGVFFSIHLISTLKFTGLVYAIIFSFFFILAYFFTKKYRKTIQLSMLFFLMHLSVLGSTGYNPYITNLISFHHPFYPLNTITIPTCGQMPANFCDNNRVYAFCYSIFSKTQNVQSPDNARLKIPYTYTVGEVSTHPIADARVGGFGLWYSAMILLSLFLLYDALQKEKIKKFNTSFWILYLLLALFVSVFINPHPWWARYVPQFYLFPFIIIIYSYLISETKIALRVRLILLITMTVNFYLTFEGTLRQNLPASKAIRAQLTNIKATDKNVLLASQGLSTISRLTDQNIKVTLVNLTELTCQNPDTLKNMLQHQVGHYCLE